MMGLALISALLLLSTLNPSLSSYQSTYQPPKVGIYTYSYKVDREGSALVVISYRSNTPSGSSWVLVPKFSSWVNRTLRGRITRWSLHDTSDVVGINYYFYKALNFTFNSEDYFEFYIEYNFTCAAMIIEPDGIFYSSQIGFDGFSSGRVRVILPQEFEIKSRQSLAIGRTTSSIYPLPPTNRNYVEADLPETLMRVEIGFKTGEDSPNLMSITMGNFTFQTVGRYSNYAERILNLYNRTYEDLVDIFNVTLENIRVEFFLPDFNLLFSIGGYVPFTGGTPGNIHINVFYTRYMEGYIEVISLHELIHHFIWAAGLSPDKFLWFHEGIAQYISIEIAEGLGYEGAFEMEKDLNESIVKLKKSEGENLGFLLRWTPSRRPRDMWTLYTAAYYVVTMLAGKYGGLQYYARFFKLINGAEVEDNNVLTYYLSLAAGEPVAPLLNSLGFNVLDLYVYPRLIVEVKRLIDGVSPLFLPYKLVAEQLYRRAIAGMSGNDVAGANNYLALAILVAKAAPLLTIMTVASIILASILYALRKAGVFEEYERPRRVRREGGGYYLEA